MLLAIDAAGTVTSQLSGADCRLFGFPAAELVGRRLEEFVSVFTELAAGDSCGREAVHQVRSLHNVAYICNRITLPWQSIFVLYINHAFNDFLTCLSAQALHTMLARSEEQPGLSWRVGVAPPPAENSAGAPPVRARPAVMQLEIVDKGTANTSNDGGTPGHAAGGISLLLKLWRADRLSGSLELDLRCGVLRADETAGLLFGVLPHAMTRQPLCKCVIQHIPCLALTVKLLEGAHSVICP